ncbi:SNF2 chromatin remodeling protein [Thelephora terrestris]|uniref:TATA-binding protein-associated factor mot1 n=1 Tax=Thelephora terrestris TaxID=56493 RepID=A0A9P6HP74_9AGAM|nr:SNF2 chromatin remodeling protein [Thelephora terrestris]
MTSRLLLLLDTGSSTSVRSTAAKQLAQLAVKSVITDVAFVEEDIKTVRQNVAYKDDQAWSELLAVLARILPYLHSKSHDTRSAATNALSQIFSSIPVWEPSGSPDVLMKSPDEPPVIPEFPNFSVKDLMERGTRLLASSGKEFVKPTAILANSSEVKKARKEAMGRLGLDFLDGLGGDEMDWEKELAPEMEPEVEAENGVKAEEEAFISPPAVSPTDRSNSSTPIPSLPVQELSEEDLSGLSARERNRLKRKRKAGNAAFVSAPPQQASGSKYTAQPTGQTNKARLIAKEDRPSIKTEDPLTNDASNGTSSDKVVVDPSKGGAVNPKNDKQSKALEVRPGTWIWDGIANVLEVDLFSQAWEVRHGAAMCLRELFKLQGKTGGMKGTSSPLLCDHGQTAEENDLAHERWVNNLAAKLLCVSVLDRFGDFVSDQDFSLSAATRLLPSTIRGDGVLRERTHVWEVRHAGLLGIKYEVAVRSDLVHVDSAKEDSEPRNKAILRDVVDATVLGLGDGDDDVRSVAASCLLPVAGHLVTQLPEELSRVLAVLWSCLRDMRDDLSSSVGAVMELLGKLVKYDEVIAILGNQAESEPLSALSPTLFPFFRHTIAGVRLAVVNTLHSFMTVPTLSKEWVTEKFLRLLFQNLIVEERSDVRDATLATWNTALETLGSNYGYLENLVTQQVLLEWYAVLMTPLGVPIDVSSFYRASSAADADPTAERHPIDKNMLAQDMGLVPIEIIWRARLVSAVALAKITALWPIQGAPFDDMFRPILKHYMGSTSMLQRFLAAVIAEEWARIYDHAAPPGAPPLIKISSLAEELSTAALTWLQDDPPAAYHEMAFSLARIHGECFNLLQSFSTDCKLPFTAIPSLGSEIDITGEREGCFTIEVGKKAVGPMFDRLKGMLGRTKKRELGIISDKRLKVVSSIDHYLEVKVQNDIRVSAACAAAFIAFKTTPDKVSPIVKGIMNSIKTRSAVAVGSFVKFCVDHNLMQPPDKIVKNLCTFLCQDAEQTPTFSYTTTILDGIISFQGSKAAATLVESAKKDSASTTGGNDSTKSRITRRGSVLAFVELSNRFGSRLLDVVPKMWNSMAGGLTSACQSADVADVDNLIATSLGQDVIDSLSVLEAVVPTLHGELRHKLSELFPMLNLTLRSRYAIIRQSAARCFSAICEVMTVDAMLVVVENVIPFISDSSNLHNRQGATELIYHIVQKLDVKALPYVIFLVVPVLGRMSDPDDDTRSTATNTFASLVKMVPLEAGLPDPPGFSQELLRRRDEERQFLAQLLDGSKVEQYVLPVKIKAELRKYQQEGINWLAFLAKYQLHGILCDDMGLGKTLQSICILASKHHERAKKYEETNSPDSVHLPSLIVCPPTLTGHWYYEILKYTENLRPIMYTGNSRDRNRLFPKLSKYDVVITSYEVVRNDINNLQAVKWHYCVLDEGHIIKNAKTKLTKAVKCIQAHHRLILSGTPIQNNVLELWSLFDFLMPGFLGTESSFNDRFSKPILSNRDGKSKNGEAAALALEALHKQVLPFLLRRLKEDVLHDLPPKIIQDYYCELSEIQKYLYDDFSKSQEKQAEEAVKSGNKEKQQHVFQSLQYLRKLCNHPALVLKGDVAAIEQALVKTGQNKTKQLNDIHHAPKLLALKQLLQDCGIGLGPSVVAENGKSELVDTEESTGGAFSQHRCLIFCQMKQMLDIIERDVFKQHMPSVTYMRLDGGTEANKRHAIVQTFNSDPSIDCLLLTTHVGGLGLTLTGADTVIFVEHDWNPMKDVQAMDRAHRIGQKKVVNVYRLITKGTLEEKIMGMQRFKLNIANSIVTQQNSGLSSMDTGFVLDLFKRTTEEEEARAAGKKRKEGAGPLNSKKVLQDVGDLHTGDEYQGLDLANFMESLGSEF